MRLTAPGAENGLARDRPRQVEESAIRRDPRLMVERREAQPLRYWGGTPLKAFPGGL